MLERKILAAPSPIKNHLCQYMTHGNSLGLTEAIYMEKSIGFEIQSKRWCGSEYWNHCNWRKIGGVEIRGLILWTTICLCLSKIWNKIRQIMWQRKNCPLQKSNCQKLLSMFSQWYHTSLAHPGCKMKPCIINLISGSLLTIFTVIVVNVNRSLANVWDSYQNVTSAICHGMRWPLIWLDNGLPKQITSIVNSMHWYALTPLQIQWTVELVGIHTKSSYALARKLEQTWLVH